MLSARLMIRKVALGLALCSLPFSTVSRAITSLDTSFLNKTVVFFFQSDLAGNATDKLDATGFLIMVPSRADPNKYPLLVTARHVVDPVWAGCAPTNPTRLFLRVNKMRFDPGVDRTGVSYIPVDLRKNGMPTWHKSDDENVDVAVLRAPAELMSGNYDVRFLNFRNIGKPEEIAKIGIGSQTASTGLVPGLQGQNRNAPVFHFGKIASIPDETTPFQCVPHGTPRPLRVWWIATTLVPGTSGSPIYFDPLFPPGADMSAGEPRAMLIGLQSLSAPGADLSGMTPVRYIFDVISHSVPGDADLTLGLPTK
jgi:hypothetical protein